MRYCTSQAIPRHVHEILYISGYAPSRTWDIVHLRLYPVTYMRYCTSQAMPRHVHEILYISGYTPSRTWDSVPLRLYPVTFIFIGQTRLVFGKCVCTCVTKHSNAFRTFLNWLKNSKRVRHEPKLHISRLPLFANFDLWSVSVWWV